MKKLVLLLSVIAASFSLISCSSCCQPQQPTCCAQPAAPCGCHHDYKGECH